MGQQRYSILNPSTRPLITIDLTPGVLRVLDYMQDYDVLPASYVKAQFESYTFTKQVITRLAKAHFIRVPAGYSHLNARYRPRPLELTDLARKALAARGMLRPRERMGTHRRRYSLPSDGDVRVQETQAIIPFHTEGMNRTKQLAGSKGGFNRASRLSPQRRSEIARLAAQARWNKKRPAP